MLGSPSNLLTHITPLPNPIDFLMIRFGHLLPCLEALAVLSHSEPLAAPQMKGNCSHVAVDLNSLNRLEKEMRTTWFSWGQMGAHHSPCGFGRDLTTAPASLQPLLGAG